MEKFVKGQCTLWVGNEYPPEYAKNIVWLRMDDYGNIMNLFIKILDDWYPLGIDNESNNSYQTFSSDHIRGLIEGSGIHIGDEPPTKDVAIWIKPGNQELDYKYNGLFNKLMKLARTIEYKPYPDMHVEVPTVYAVVQALDLKVSKSSINQPEGVVGIGEDGYMQERFLPPHLREGMKFLGYWDASTNTPNIDKVDTEGHFYIASKEGVYKNIRYYKNDFVYSYKGEWMRMVIFPDEALDTKVDKIQGMGLSTNDFNNTYKGKLDGIENEAQKNTNSIKVVYTATEHDPINNLTIDREFNESSFNPIANATVAKAFAELPKSIVMSESEYENITPLEGVFYYLYEE